MDSHLPPGPRPPRALQTLEWLHGSHRVMDRCRRGYGDIFTVRMLPAAVTGPGARARDGDWVFLADPELVSQVFTADPDVVRTGPTNRFLEGVVGPGSILVSRRARAHASSASCCCRPSTASASRRYRELIAEVTRAEIASLAGRAELPLWPRMQAITLEVIVRAVFGITDPERAPADDVLLRDMLDRLTSARWVLWSAALRGRRRRGRRARRSRATRVLAPVDAAILEEIRSAPRRRPRPRATTSSRC